MASGRRCIKCNAIMNANWISGTCCVCDPAHDRRCAGCGAPLSLRTRSDYCRACRHKVIKRKTRLKNLTPRCLGCKEEMTRMAPDGLCGACRAEYREVTA